MTSAFRTRRLARAPAATLIYAIGDLHGRLDLLEAVTSELRGAARRATHDVVRVIAVFLGNYIDRGPDSAGVLEHLAALRDAGFCDTVFLRGNHEQVLLDLLDGKETTSRWLEFGGCETLESYGRWPGPSERDIDQLREIARRAIPADHVAFLRATRLHAVFGDYFFVHAGMRPDLPVGDQSESDFLWHCYESDDEPAAGHTIIHGHAPCARPIQRRSRIGINTNAYRTGDLTVLKLRDDKQELLKFSARDDAASCVITPWGPDEDIYFDIPAAAVRNVNPAPQIGAPARPAPKRRSRRPAAVLAALGALVAAALALNGLRPAAPIAVNAADAGPAPLTAPAENPAATRPAPGRPAPSLVEPDEALSDVSATAPMEIAPAAPNPLSPDLMEAAIDRNAPRATPEADASPAPAAAQIRVQVAAAGSPEGAMRAWNEIASAYPADTQGKSSQVEPAAIGGKTLHRTLVAGFATADQAKAFCRKLAAAGRGCLVRLPAP
jgi:serine/threonine protein phosphatase 1